MQQEAIERLLPSVMQSGLGPGSPLSALLGAMEEMHALDLEILAAFDTYINPATAPEDFLPFLSRWVDLDWLFDDLHDGAVPPAPSDVRRLLVAAPRLSRWRGTGPGLQWFLELAAGQRGFHVRDGDGRPFHVTVVAPASAVAHKALVERIVRVERPAHATYTILWEGVDNGPPPSDDEEG